MEKHSIILEDLKWEGFQTFDEIITWGLDPIRHTLEIFDQNCVQSHIHGDDPELAGFYYDIRTKVERLDRVLQRMGNDVRGNNGKRTGDAATS